MKLSIIGSIGSGFVDIIIGKVLIKLSNKMIFCDVINKKSAEFY